MENWIVDQIMGDINDAVSLIKAAITITPAVTKFFNFLAKISPWLALGVMALINRYARKK